MRKRKRRKVLAADAPQKTRKTVALEAIEHKHGRVLTADDSPVDASDDFLKIAEKYALARASLQAADDEQDAAKKLVNQLEGFLLEEMGAACKNVQVIVSVPGVGERKYTIYKIDDTKVWAAEGKGTVDIVSACHAVGWDETCSETYSGQTLKASVKEARRQFAELEDHQLPWFCNDCQKFVDDEGTPDIYKECPECEAALVRMEGGIPKALSDVLYIEDFQKLGCRSA